MSRRTNKRQGNAKMIYSRLPDLFLSFLSFCLSVFLPFLHLPSIPFPSTLPPPPSRCRCLHRPSLVHIFPESSHTPTDSHLIIVHNASGVSPSPCLLRHVYSIAQLGPSSHSPSLHHIGASTGVKTAHLFPSTAYRGIGAVHHQMHAIVINAACAAGPTSCMLP